VFKGEVGGRNKQKRKRDEIIGGWRTVYNEELHHLYASPNIIRMIRRRMRWLGHVACMGRRGMHIGFWGGSQKDKD
jgi:hypothetical protein